MDAAELETQRSAVEKEIGDLETRIASAAAEGNEDLEADLKENLKAAKDSLKDLKATEPEEAAPLLSGDPEYDNPDAGWREGNPPEAAGTDTEVSEEAPETYGPEDADKDAQKSDKNTDDVPEEALEATYGDESLAKDPAVQEEAAARKEQAEEEAK